MYRIATFWPFTATSCWLPVKRRYFRLTFGHVRSRDVISCHVTASSCELQPCRKWNVHYMQGFGLLQPLFCDFRSNNVTFVSLTATWGHVTSFSATWLPPPASYSIVGSEMYSIREFWPSRATSRWLLVKWVPSGWLPVTWGHVTSFPVTWLPPPACYSLVGSEMYRIQKFLPSTGASRWLSVKWRHFRVTCAHLRSRDVISCLVSVSLSELVPCREWNVQYTRVFGFLQPLPGTSSQKTLLPGHFWSRKVTWRHFLSHDCLLLRATAL